jgi:NTP pyrophosphatase (non-canonical NTP hydrolase)
MAENTTNILAEVYNERERQDAKWGEQNHHPFLYLAVLGEEVGEANQAALQATFGGKTWADYRQELIETAAVAVAMVECLDRHGGAPPAEPGR